ncbi:metallo-beta-lactamase domain-containing protein 1 isoform X2 [Haemaphysalis longicornis]
MRSASRKEAAHSAIAIKSSVKEAIVNESGSYGRSPVIDFFASAWERQPQSPSPSAMVSWSEEDSESALSGPLEVSMPPEDVQESPLKQSLEKLLNRLKRQSSQSTPSAMTTPKRRKQKMDYDVHVIKEGYSLLSKDGRTMVANGTSTLVRGPGFNIIVDTLSAWDKDFLVESLEKLGVSCDEINYVVCTHGHSDHIGNLNLFQRATHIIGTTVSSGDVYQLCTFENDEPYRIATDVQVIPTPGHTLTDVSVVVKTAKLGTVAITGDLFEKVEDIGNPKLWRELGGSEDPKQQCKSRQMILDVADYIIPGHGPMFRVTEHMREEHARLFECHDGVSEGEEGGSP